jgi:hypothetical protein
LELWSSGESTTVSLHRSVERANPFERLAKSILDIGVARREPCRFPQKRKGARVVALLFELDRPPIHISRACVGDLSKRNRRRRANQRQPSRKARSERHERPILQG